MTPLKITAGMVAAEPRDAEKGAAAFVQEQIDMHMPFLNDGRFSLSEQSFRAALGVAYYMGAVSALKTEAAA